jgi:hypothetical protein
LRAIEREIFIAKMKRESTSAPGRLLAPRPDPPTAMFRNTTNPGGRLARRSLFNVRASVAALALASTALPLGAAVLDFGDLSLAASSYYNGGPATNSAGWSSGGVSFSNTFTDFGGGYSSWAGFAYSNTSDTTSSGFGNQYSAYSLTAPNSGVYGIAYYSAYDPAPRITFAGEVAPQSVLLTNNTYAALEMLDGSAFAKKFGGATGDDADWFTVTFTGYDAGNAETGAVTFYLADYRFSNNALDYVVSDWTSVDLTGLGTGVKSITLVFDSSDVGMFGINTPTYAALDNLSFAAVPEPSAAAAFAGLAALVAGSFRRRRATAAA